MAGSSDAGVVSHSDSASREMALRRCLRARDATKADEGKDEDAEEAEEDEEAKELEEAIGCGSWRRCRAHGGERREWG